MYRYLSVAVSMLNAVSVHDRILGVAALTGYRVAEIDCTEKLARIEGSEFRAKSDFSIDKFL